MYCGCDFFFFDLKEYPNKSPIWSLLTVERLTCRISLHLSLGFIHHYQSVHKTTVHFAEHSYQAVYHLSLLVPLV